MAGTVAKIIVGRGVVKIGDCGAAIGAAADVGSVDGGVTFENAQEFFDVRTDDFLGTIRKHKTNEKMTVKFVLAEAQLENLAIAFGYPTTAVVASVFTFGGNAVVTERSLYINGIGPSGGTRAYVLHKCVMVGSGVHSMKKDDKTMIEMEFEVLEDSSKTANERYGTMTDSGADTTAPTIVLTTPADGATVVKATSGTVLWTITETNAMDENTIVYGDTFQIINTTTPASAVLVAGTIVYDSTAKTVTFTPTVVWNASDTMQVTVSTGLKDIAGNRLAAPKIEQFSVTA